MVRIHHPPCWIVDVKIQFEQPNLVLRVEQIVSSSNNDVRVKVALPHRLSQKFIAFVCLANSLDPPNVDQVEILDHLVNPILVHIPRIENLHFFPFQRVHIHFELGLIGWGWGGSGGDWGWRPA